MSLEQMAEAGKDMSYGAQANRVSECIERMAYRLAGAPGSNSEVADAVMGGCTDLFRGVVAAQIAAAQTGGVPFSATSTANGLDTTAEGALFEDMRRLALFSVTQARAGHCDVELAN